MRKREREKERERKCVCACACMRACVSDGEGRFVQSLRASACVHATHLEDGLDVEVVRGDLSRLPRLGLDLVYAGI